MHHVTERREPVFSSLDIENKVSHFSSEEPALFKVRFDSRASPGLKKFPMRGKGHIAVREDQIQCGGKQSWLIGFRTETSFPLSDIYDVVTDGKRLQFVVDVPLGPMQVSCRASSAEEANEMANRLPERKTEAFVRAIAEHADFRQRLDRLSPRSPMTLAIVALNVLIFLGMWAGGAGLMETNPAIAVKWGSNFGPLTLSGQWWRLLTATFIHFGLFHVALNMTALYQTGRIAERLFGSTRFLLLYLIAGLTGSLVSLLWHPGINSAGASGAIFGVFGGLLAFTLNPRNAVPPSIMAAHRNSTLAFIVFNLANGFTHAGIDNGAHLGGLFGGLIVGYLFARPLTDAVRQKIGVRNLAGTLAIAGAGMGLLFYPLLHPSENLSREIRFRQVLTVFAEHEKTALDEANKLARQMKENPKVVSAKVGADVLEKQILPEWEEMYRSIDEAKLDAQSPNVQFRQGLLQYLYDRKMTVKISADYLKTNDRSLVAELGSYAQDMKLQLDAMKKLGVH